MTRLVEFDEEDLLLVESPVIWRVPPVTLTEPAVGVSVPMETT